jgi:hypothetical protein
MIEQWQPAPKTTDSHPDAEVLSRLARAADRFAETGTCEIDDEELLRVHGWLKIQETVWHEVLADMSPEALYPLAVFFTLAEQKLPGWQAGARNPAIWACRMLKHLGQTPNKEKVRYLKSLTDNRYIPWGKVI